MAASDERDGEVDRARGFSIARQWARNHQRFEDALATWPQEREVGLQTTICLGDGAPRIWLRAIEYLAVRRPVQFGVERRNALPVRQPTASVSTRRSRIAQLAGEPQTCRQRVA